MTPRPIRLDGGGLELAADLWGNPDDPPVVFLHGAGQNRRAWDEAARSVARAGWHAVTVDHRGHGDSDWPIESSYDWDHFGDDVEALIDRFSRPPVMVGASLGGMSALIAQGRSDTQLYRALVLVDVTPRMELDGVKRIVGFMAAHPEGFDSLDDASQVIADYTGRPKPDSPEGLRQVLRHGDDGRWRWHWDIRFLEGRADEILSAQEGTERSDAIRTMLLDAASQVRVPTLVVRGAQSDMVSPEAVREFVDIVPGSRFVDVADAGHMVAGDQNDHFVSAVLEFLSDLHSDPKAQSS
jgi:pimeloyl-ACP methyl ester carboxylesterase